MVYVACNCYNGLADCHVLVEGDLGLKKFGIEEINTQIRGQDYADYVDFCSQAT